MGSAPEPSEPEPATPVTTVEPEPEPEPEPESGTDGMICKATPGLNRGVSDSDCAQCETGYKWWPCNDAELCECTGTALAQFGAKMEPKKRSARTKHVRKRIVSLRQTCHELELFSDADGGSDARPSLRDAHADIFFCCPRDCRPNAGHVGGITDMPASDKRWIPTFCT